MIINRLKQRKSIFENLTSYNFCFQSRVIELKQSLTELMLKYVNRKYFQSDIAAFSTLVSLNILVSTDKLSTKAKEQFLATQDSHVS